jgi:hypothetical protein
MKKYIDDIPEEVIINQLVKQADQEEQRRQWLIDKYNKQITEIERELGKNIWRDSVKRQYREYLGYYKEQRRELINKYNIRYE